ncbi:family 43 glycosylhydrolase [[Clostridium] polysaccharolyticum]|uniref:Carbohydrate binding module (Family 6) n=1 Tax=[Clostridium] polysaccharolyticum TaxID=29364 RepID=A0A1I0CH20_9FIRM|nr:family 43 glycosylhydrolase [[Clostridium] polysaccharolyticum]SET18660.1 Carbohydrate binding module (family 6) [[Clostridium] polysaccharolyticum]
MSNPYLPNWEYIPDGEPRAFGDRVYIYGSHDKAASDRFCDTRLKVWSASIHDLNNWKCHGDIFHTNDDEDHANDCDWAKGHQLFAPDVVEKDGKYYLYAYIENCKGCVAVADKPEGPFKLLSQYKYNVPEGCENIYNGGIFIDPGVLVDDDGRVYIYCGYLSSYMAEINPENMYEIIDGTYQKDIIPVEEPFRFFEACSPRKIGDTYYLIYSCGTPSQLVYATSKMPTGPFEYRGVIIDNGVDYPAGNDHGSICKIGDQWYIFYHRMTNGTIMSRRGCVEKIEILPDGSIPQVEMTSLGFEEALNPYKITDPDIACVLKGGCLITEKNLFSRVITNITDGCVIGYKYFDFGEDYSSKTMDLALHINGCGCKGKVYVRIDKEDGEEIGCVEFGMDDSIVTGKMNCVTGRHAVYFVVKAGFSGGFAEMFHGRQLFELKEFVFCK